MMHGGPSGFHNAPLTRTLVISIAIITVTSGLCGRSRRIGLAYQDQVSGKIITKGPKVGCLFPLLPSPSLVSNSIAYNLAQCDNQVWHRCLGQPNSRVFQILLKSGLLGNKNSTSSNNVIVDCASCKLGKNKTLPFPLHTSCIIKPFELVHSDVWGIAPVISYEHYKYFVTFIDDFTCFT